MDDHDDHDGHTEFKKNLHQAIQRGWIREIDHVVKEANDVGCDIMKLRYSLGMGTEDTDVSVLMLGIMESHDAKVIQCLLRNGADVTYGTPGGLTPLHLLAMANVPVFKRPFILDTAREFITLGANVDALHNAKTPIFYALRTPEMVRLLIEAGCDVHYRITGPSNIDMTLLMYAAQTGHPESVHLLIKAGADLDLKDNRGWTAVDWARFAENVGATKVLEEAIWYRDSHLMFALGNHAKNGNESLIRLLHSDAIDEILDKLIKSHSV